MLISLLQIVYGLHSELFERYEISVSQKAIFPFHVYFVFTLLPTRLLPDSTIWVTRWMSYKKQELLNIREHLDSPPNFCAVRVAHFLRFRFVFCLSSFCVLWSICLWIVNSWLPLWFCITFYWDVIDGSLLQGKINWLNPSYTFFSLMFYPKVHPNSTLLHI